MEHVLFRCLSAVNHCWIMKTSQTWTGHVTRSVSDLWFDLMQVCECKNTDLSLVCPWSVSLSHSWSNRMVSGFLSVFTPHSPPPTVIFGCGSSSVCFFDSLSWRTLSYKTGPSPVPGAWTDLQWMCLSSCLDQHLRYSPGFEPSPLMWCLFYLTFWATWTLAEEWTDWSPGLGGVGVGVGV